MSRSSSSSRVTSSRPVSCYEGPRSRRARSGRPSSSRPRGRRVRHGPISQSWRIFSHKSGRYASSRFSGRRAVREAWSLRLRVRGPYTTRSSEADVDPPPSDVLLGHASSGRRQERAQATSSTTMIREYPPARGRWTATSVPSAPDYVLLGLGGASAASAVAIARGAMRPFRASL